jgi:hypothetical protein
MCNFHQPLALWTRVYADHLIISSIINPLMLHAHLRTARLYLAFRAIVGWRHRYRYGGSSDFGVAGGLSWQEECCGAEWNALLQ